MLLWQRNFQTIRSIHSLPRLFQVAQETVDERANYRFDGDKRPREGHCIFKYTLSGVGIFKNATGEHRCPAGTGFLVKVNDPATSYYYPENGNEPWEFVYVAFYGTAANAMVDDLTQRFGPLYQLPPNSFAINHALEFRGWDDRRCVITPTQGARIINDLLFTLIESKQSPEKKTSGRQLVRRVREFVFDNLCTSFTVSDIADSLQVSREYLSRCFKQETGMAPHAFAVRQKMLHACRLLKNSSMSCKEISAALNFDTSGHFNHTFSKTIGMPPGRFRREGHLPPR